MIEFYLATTEMDYAAAKLLFEEYAISININLDFQHFDEELEQLKKMYASPVGGIILAKQDNKIIGCVAIRKITNEIGELKRMFIKPEHQHKGIGKDLLSEAIQLAKKCNYSILKLDTLNYMLPAITLYKNIGFYETPAYYHNPIETAMYFELVL